MANWISKGLIGARNWSLVIQLGLEAIIGTQKDQMGYNRATLVLKELSGDNAWLDSNELTGSQKGSLGTTRAYKWAIGAQKDLLEALKDYIGAKKDLLERNVWYTNLVILVSKELSGDKKRSIMLDWTQWSYIVLN